MHIVILVFPLVEMMTPRLPFEKPYSFFIAFYLSAYGFSGRNKTDFFAARCINND
jgi:hypothetical protein